MPITCYGWKSGVKVDEVRAHAGGFPQLIRYLVYCHVAQECAVYTVLVPGLVYLKCFILYLCRPKLNKGTQLNVGIWLSLYVQGGVDIFFGKGGR
jgi:hypothetical protein